MAGAGPAAVDWEANTMRVLVSENGLNQQGGTEPAVRRSVPVFLAVSFSIAGIAVAYFGILYLIAH
jgi:hypothetical protein